MDDLAAPSEGQGLQVLMARYPCQAKPFLLGGDLAQNVGVLKGGTMPRDLGGPQESCIAHKVKALEGPAQFAHQSSLKQQSA